MSKMIAEGDIPSLWKEYKSTNDTELRNKLVEIYLPLVEVVARAIWKGLPKSNELDDLISSGCFGLIGAVERFDLSRGIKFETYCKPRICGAIRDYLREKDWMPRLTRFRWRIYQKVVEALNNSDGNMNIVPTAQDIADCHSVSLEEAQLILIEATTMVRMVHIQKK